MQKSVAAFMIKSPYVGDAEMGLQEALEFLTECGVRHLPIVEDNKLIGLVSERDLRACTALPQVEKLTVGDIMKRNVYVAERSTPLREIVGTMQERKIGSTVIVNRSSEVLGIFTVIDALGILGEFLDDESTEDVFIDDYYDAWDLNARC